MWNTWFHFHLLWEFVLFKLFLFFCYFSTVVSFEDIFWYTLHISWIVRTTLLFTLTYSIHMNDFWLNCFIKIHAVVCGIFHGIPVTSTNKTDHPNITEILLKVVLNTIAMYLDSISQVLELYKENNIIFIYVYICYNSPPIYWLV